MEEKKYLKWYNKIGYGSGDIAGNVVYAFLTSFMMVYLTDSVGLAAGVVGTLIAVSKLFDGFTDIFFGSMIDKTHSKMGKAKPWMLYGYIGCAITLVCCFAVPVSLGTTAKYAWFFNHQKFVRETYAHVRQFSPAQGNASPELQPLSLASCVPKSVPGYSSVERSDEGRD